MTLGEARSQSGTLRALAWAREPQERADLERVFVRLRVGPLFIVRRWRPGDRLCDVAPLVERRH